MQEHNPGSLYLPPAQVPVPVRPKDRIAIIDVLRGLALFGVLMVNLITEFRVSVFEQFLPPAHAMATRDRLTEAFVGVWLESKAITLFSLLFGVGLAIQFERLANGKHRWRLLFRRLVVLLMFGLIHLCLIWNGDILTEYAMLGLVALPFLYLTNRALMIVALMLFAFHACQTSFVPSSFWPTQSWMQQSVTDANRVYATGGYLGIIEFRMHEMRGVLPLLLWISPRTFAVFLTGILAWRSGLFSHPDRHQRMLFAVSIVGLSLGAALTLSDGANRDSFGGRLLEFLWPLVPLAPVVLALGYAGAVACLVAFTGARRVLNAFAPLGRMAFTNYILQSLIFGWVFYGYGLGLFGRVSAGATLLLGMLLYTAQMIGSAWWLGRFRYGPIEWLWRTMMYGVRQPMSLSKYRPEASTSKSAL